MSQQCFNIGRVCKSPFYLTWKNTLGGWDYWLFDTIQIHAIRTNRLGDFSPYQSDLSNQNYTKRLLKKDALESVLVGGDDITQQEAIGLSQLFYSPSVLYLKEWNPPTAPVWVEVDIDDADKELYNSCKVFNEISFTVLFPNKYTLSN